MTCQKDLIALGKPYPRTCEHCGLGPCKHIIDNRFTNVSDDDLIQEVRKRGFVIRDAQISSKPWVGLSVAELSEIDPTHWSVVIDIDAKLKEKNT
jgi:hypothetical protein